MNDPILNEMRGMLIFARVVESGSFSAAARRLGISRAVVSYQIKQLETRIGVRLLNRSTRRLSLTASGRQYHESCKRIAAEADSAHSLIQNLREEAVGRVALACPVNLGMQWVVPIINQFRNQYPQIALDLQFSESLSNLIEEGIDIAIRSGPLDDSELKAVNLATVSRHICASPDYLQRNGWPKSPADLSEHEWVVYKRLSSKLLVSRADTSIAITMSGSLATNNAAARLQFALAGHGIALLPQYDVGQSLKSGELIELLPDYRLPSLELFAVFPTGSTDARASQLMLNMLKENPPTI